MARGALSGKAQPTGQTRWEGSSLAKQTELVFLKSGPLWPTHTDS
jgi:hypothetical protein